MCTTLRTTLRDNIGRLVLSAVSAFAVVGPYLFDWNNSHIFRPQWPPHARFHGVVSAVMTSMLATAALWQLWQLWRPGRYARDGASAFATLIPLAYWGPFLVAPLVPGTGVEDPGHTLARIGGVPGNMLGTAALATTGLGWYLDRHLPSESACVA
jgi:hypothetical protein